LCKLHGEFDDRGSKSSLELVPAWQSLASSFREQELPAQTSRRQLGDSGSDEKKKHSADIISMGIAKKTLTEEIEHRDLQAPYVRNKKVEHRERP
jgi:hypothetical protein